MHHFIDTWNLLKTLMCFGLFSWLEEAEQDEEKAIEELKYYFAHIYHGVSDFLIEISPILLEYIVPSSTEHSQI